jgi:hypothetical protein
MLSENEKVGQFARVKSYRQVAPRLGEYSGDNFQTVLGRHLLRVRKARE